MSLVPVVIGRSLFLDIQVIVIVTFCGKKFLLYTDFSLISLLLALVSEAHCSCYDDTLDITLFFHIMIITNALIIIINMIIIMMIMMINMIMIMTMMMVITCQQNQASSK